MTKQTLAVEDGPRDVPGIEVTPEMIEAGVEALVCCGYGADGEPTEFLRQATVKMFQAMDQARRKGHE
jgi:hypothetical protein